MLSLPDGAGWAHIIVGRIFASQGIPPQLWGVCAASLIMNSFHFVATFNIVAYP